MITKAILAYIVIFIINFIAYYIEGQFFSYLIPFLLLFLPLIAGSTLNFKLSKKHFYIFGVVSSVTIIPYVLFEIYQGKVFILPELSLLLFQLLVVSVPEETFFRGFIQENIGNNIRGILITSLMFSFAHLPVFLFDNNIYAILTFFPSLVIGYIYLKTSNIIPCIIFHFLANIIWIGFR